MAIRRAIERRIIAANTFGGLLVGSYLISLRDVSPGETLLQWWAAVVITSLSLNILGAGLTLLLSRRYLGPVLRFLDEARPPTEDERALLVRTPRTITRLVYGGWTIAAVIIGGTALSGGRGTIIGAVIGALIIQVISTGILFLGVDVKWSTFVTGAVIIIAVALDQLVRRQRHRRARDAVDLG